MTHVTIYIFKKALSFHFQLLVRLRGATIREDADIKPNWCIVSESQLFWCIIISESGVSQQKRRKRKRQKV